MTARKGSKAMFFDPRWRRMHLEGRYCDQHHLRPMARLRRKGYRWEADLLEYWHGHDTLAEEIGIVRSADQIIEIETDAERVFLVSPSLPTRREAINWIEEALLVCVEVRPGKRLDVARFRHAVEAGLLKRGNRVRGGF